MAAAACRSGLLYLGWAGLVIGWLDRWVGRHRGSCRTTNEQARRYSAFSCVFPHLGAETFVPKGEHRAREGVCTCNWQFFARRAPRKRGYRRPGNVVSFRPLVPHRRAQKISPSLLDSHYTTANRVNRCRYPACCAWCAAKISSSRAASWHWPPLARWCGTARASSDCSDIGLTKGCANPNLEYGKGLRSF